MALNAFTTAPRMSAPRRASPVIVPAGAVTWTRILGTGLVGGVMFVLASSVPAPAAAQGNPQSVQTGACEQPPHTPATPPARGADSGTQPGGAGSTGWSGGTGGSNIGTTPQAGTHASPDRQPAVVTGLDPKAEPQARC
ncbi:hypothetical protein EZH22_15005 [Xanthobacter dioxanivorans]|uniref:Uncharacterized protein n=1 Tax=Xanthobacter dioxanivorans TaxID=2528964 RepID=A0A974PK45_9HYPH|nr:hypothetical protein [Xanthobacter dioxanivorans]QRG04505.1 hypothetical protein EZH22_15005 [Xanthobacter dioxanivorans]